MFKWISVFVGIGLAGGGFYLFWPSPEAPKPIPTQPVAESTPVPTPTPTPPNAIQYPVPDTDAAENKAPLPKLDESDESVEKALSRITGIDRLKLLLNDAIVRRIVVTVANEKEQKFPQEFSPFKPIEKQFVVDGNEETSTLSNQNYIRYAPYIQLVKAMDYQKLASFYIHHYSLFQTAYQELGTPGYFNDRLIEAIDDMLKTPQVAGPIKLVQPKVYYQFSDPQLESLTAGQKLLIRIGPENAVLVKSKLKEFRKFVIKIQ